MCLERKHFCSRGLKSDGTLFDPELYCQKKIWLRKNDFQPVSKLPQIKTDQKMSYLNLLINNPIPTTNPIINCISLKPGIVFHISFPLIGIIGS